MCGTQSLQILICITTVLVSSNGAPQDRISGVDKLKRAEMDYGERLSSMEDDQEPTLLRDELDRSGKGVVSLVGKVKPKSAPQAPQKGVSTKCTTNQPIKADTDNINADDTTIDEAVTLPMTDPSINDTTPDAINATTPNDLTGGSDKDKNGSADDSKTGSSGENKVESDKGEGLNEDPAKEDDDDATTKKYFSPQASYIPDHYLDDAKK